MLPLRSKAELLGWQSPPLIKVASLAEFAAGEFPLEHMALDLRGPCGDRISESLAGLPWAGFLVEKGGQPPAGRPTIRLTENQHIVQPGDVVELQPTVSQLAVRYRRGDNGNVLFATERCNSFCLMCSQPPRQVEDSWRTDGLCELISLIDKDEPSLAISGGEPTLLGDGLVDVIRKCADVLPRTQIHVLSNGRRFAQTGFAEKFRSVHESLSWGIPLYGDHFGLHDFVVQSKGAFAETLRGLYALHLAGQEIEIRVVLVKPTVKRLTEIARFIYRNLPFVNHVALMGIEPIGFAKANYELIWIDPADAMESICTAIQFLEQRGMDVSIYNLPLCVIPESFRRFAKPSISKWKQNYLPACNDCDERQTCGGFFDWITPKWTSRSICTIRKETLDA